MSSRSLISVISVIGLALSPTGCIRLEEPPAGFSCTVDEDCPEGEPCQVTPGAARGICRESGKCDDSADCGPTEICSGGVCVTVECTDRAPESCSPYLCQNNTCLETCQSDFGCFSLNGASCIDGKCVEHECNESCSGGFACVDGFCASSCLDSEDCGAGFYCEQGLCETKRRSGEACTTAVECASGSCCVEDGTARCSQERNCDEVVCVGVPNPCERRNLADCEAEGACAVVDTGTCVGGNYEVDCAGIAERTSICVSECASKSVPPYCGHLVDCLKFGSSTCASAGTSKIKCEWQERSCQGDAATSCSGVSVEICSDVPGCRLVER